MPLQAIIAEPVRTSVKFVRVVAPFGPTKLLRIFRTTTTTTRTLRPRNPVIPGPRRRKARSLLKVAAPRKTRLLPTIRSTCLPIQLVCLPLRFFRSLWTNWLMIMGFLTTLWALSRRFRPLPPRRLGLLGHLGSAVRRFRLHDLGLPRDLRPEQSQTTAISRMCLHIFVLGRAQPVCGPNSNR